MISNFVKRNPIRFNPDPKRVIARFYVPGPEAHIKNLIHRISKMPDQAAQLSLNQSLRDFSPRHRNISKVFQSHFERIKNIFSDLKEQMEAISEYKQLLIGAYCTMEYSIESAAFFNPSVIEDPDQSGLEHGYKRVIFSFRATGEGHISSIVFRGGILDPNNNLEMITSGKLVDEPELFQNTVYQKEVYQSVLKNIEADPALVAAVMDKLRFEFDFNDLNQAYQQVIIEKGVDEAQKRKLETVLWSAKSHYKIGFSLDTAISERVVFPMVADESNGMEDARFVKFTDDNGSVKYYATYTAYNGRSIMPKLIETKDFYKFNMMPIHGDYAHNKGMAVFPRKIKGKYAMLSRVDGINNFIMYSDDITLWQEAKMIQEPMYPWEFIKVGNCGSPIETDEGWIVITHGVGPVRKYSMGATLLDLDDPTKVIGQSSEPILAPNTEEREGYVPNVVYSCGAILHNEHIVLPYAMSDTSSTYATIPVHDLLSKLKPSSLKKAGVKKAETKAKILVVDDEIINQQVIASYLKSVGYEVEIAPDGIVALMKIANHKFDAILSDISMPNFDGYQLLDYLNENHIEIPVVFITALASKEDEIKGLKMGAVEYITKPIEKDILLIRLEKLLTES
ncbi:MAG TPA: response regulator [Bacteroidales bacterium]|nr:response regulator [Bacteroidales bacterium]